MLNLGIFTYLVLPNSTQWIFFENKMLGFFLFVEYMLSVHLAQF